ncbi:hypothetical protein D3C78_1093270 [compost metagenome]
MPLTRLWEMAPVSKVAFTSVWLTQPSEVELRLFGERYTKPFLTLPRLSSGVVTMESKVERDTRVLLEIVTLSARSCSRRMVPLSLVVSRKSRWVRP